MIRVILKPGRDKAVRAFHPWIFSGAIDRLDEGFAKSELVRVLSDREEFLGIGYFNPDSQISVRMLTFKDELIDDAFFVKRFENAKWLRESLISHETNAYRLVHSEGDFLPGLILDRYGDFISAQFLTAGMENLKPIILKAIAQVFQPKGVFDRSDSETRKQEGLKTEHGVLAGEPPLDELEICEGGARFQVDLKRGQKTGFFLDQRENRFWVRAHAKEKRVLDCFSYAGGFSIHAAMGGAISVTAVEEQARACNLIRANFERNQFRGENYRTVQADVFEFLRKDQETYDLIVLDPPAFCKRRDQVQQAARGYKDINLQALKRARNGGLLFTSSCSAFIDANLFQKIVFGAAKDSGREVQIIQKTSHAFDHPINIYHPEGEYLKGLLLHIL